MSTEYQEVSTGFIARNSNPRIWIAKQNEIKGGSHQYNTLEEFMNLHPDKMEVGMTVTVNEHQRDLYLYKTTSYKLITIPDISLYPLKVSPNQLDGSGNEILVGGEPVPEPSYFLNFWQIENQLNHAENDYAIEYAPDVNGLRPPYPYVDNQSAEASWSNTFVAGSSKWYRIRRNDELIDGTSIYKNWTVPLPINGNFQSGDYVANLFKRSATAPPLPPRFTKDGLLNNDPSGWQDTPPVGSDPLYEIRAPKDLYGNLKDSWIGPFLIPEDEDLVRYNSQAVPNPNNIVDTSTPATAGSQADTDLNDAGWVKTYDPSIHKYRAKRTENAPNDYTSWTLDKISEESGEYIDRIYKLFPINQDFDDLTFINNNTPTGNDPISNPTGASENNGWADTPYSETDTHINCFSQARKFMDGSLKTPWSSPQPFTGKDVYSDYISSDGGSVFKYPSSEDEAAGSNSDPTDITLTAHLFKGLSEIITGVTYKWFKVYDNKAIIPVDPNTDTPLSTNQSITVNPTDVATKATFKCFMTLAVSGGTDIQFNEEFSITDITDGDDAKTLTVAADTPIVVYDTAAGGPTDFSVPELKIRGRQNFLDGVTFYWFKDDGAGNWEDLSNPATGSITAFADAGAGQVTVTSAGHGLSANDRINITGTTNYNGSYNITNVTTNTFEITATWVADDATGTWDQDFYTLGNQSLVVNTEDVFLPNGNKQTARYILTTNLADPENVDAYYDIVTIAKLSSAGVGAPGEGYTGILSNEVDSAILDRATGQPVAGEIGSGGRIFTLVQVYNNGTKLVQGSDYTITDIASDDVNITFGQTASGNDIKVYINTWTATTTRAVTATIEITLTGGEIIYKTFTISSNLDDAGALIPFIQVASGSANPTFAFTPSNRDDIKLEVVLDQNGTAIDPNDFDGNVVWKYNGVQTNTNLTGTNLINKTVKRTDVTGSVSVTAEITYNGVTYIAIPTTINDITDGKIYRIYYDYGSNAVPSEPISTPALPSDTLVSNYTSTFGTTITTQGWYRQAGSKTYFVSDGLVEDDGSGNDIIRWQPAYRIKGENGSNGSDGNDGDKGWSARLSLAPRNNGAEQVLKLTWVGGAGAKPSFNNYYLGPSGSFVSNINNAENIKGDNANSRPEYHTQIGSRTYTPSIAFPNDFDELLRDGGPNGNIRRLNVVNNHTSNRKIMIHGQFYAATANENIRVELMMSPNNYTYTPSKGSLTKVDEAWIYSKNKADVWWESTFLPGENKYFYLWITEISGSGFYGNIGFLEAWGL